MQKRHTDRKLYFDEQVYTTQKYVMPFIGIDSYAGLRVLEIGAGEGGNLLPFAGAGAECVGVDLSEVKILAGREVMARESAGGRVELICKNIFDVDNIGTFDIILMKDVIEHIPEQTTFLANLQRFMHVDTRIVITYPPYLNPFAGHQQVCRHRLISKLPFVYLLPNSLYRSLLTKVREDQATVAELLELKQTGLTIERLEKCIKKAGLAIEKRQHYLINPNYEVKFGLPPVRQIPILGSIAWLRNFYTTASFYILTARK